MEIGLFSLLPVSPIVNLPFPSLRSGSRGALLLSVPGGQRKLACSATLHVLCVALHLYPDRFLK